MISYGGLTTFLHDPGRGVDALAFARDAAREFGAHLQVICAGIDSADPIFYTSGAQAIAVQQNLRVARDVAARLEGLAADFLSDMAVPHGIETASMMASALTSYLTGYMRYADLAVLPLPYDAGRSQIDAAGFNACLFGADLPVLVAPSGAHWHGPPGRIMIAWDDGAEALAAVRAALPLLQAAQLIDICIIDPPGHGIDRSDPGGRLAEMLTRAGCRVEVSVANKGTGDIATELLRRADAMRADLIVMGAYGHSRLREAVIGGVTRSMLRNSHLPVLMAR